jgi:hypothetical protein
MNNIGNAKAFPQILQAWNCQCDFFLPENPDSADAAESMGLKGEFRQWEDLLRIADRSRFPLPAIRDPTRQSISAGA